MYGSASGQLISSGLTLTKSGVPREQFADLHELLEAADLLDRAATRVESLDRDVLREALPVEIVEEDAEHGVRQTVEDLLRIRERHGGCRLDDGSVNSVLKIDGKVNIVVSHQDLTTHRSTAVRNELKVGEEPLLQGRECVERELRWRLPLGSSRCGRRWGRGIG